MEGATPPYSINTWGSSLKAKFLKLKIKKMEALFRFRDLIKEIDILFLRCKEGVFFIEPNKVEEYFENLIDRIRNFDVTDIEDELIGSADRLKDNLRTVRFTFRNTFYSLNDSGLFPESKELEPMRKTLEEVNGAKWANDVLCGLASVADWANGLIGEVCTILDELSELVQADVETNNDGNKLPNKEQEKVTESSSITRKKSTRKKKIYNFSDIIQYHDKKELLERLHFLIDGRGGAAVGAVIQKAKMDGYLTRYPYEGDFRQEFEVKGSWSAISNYFNENDINCLVKSADVIIFKDKISN